MFITCTEMCRHYSSLPRYSRFSRQPHFACRSCEMPPNRWFNRMCRFGAFPVVLGRGKRLVENGARPCALRLVASKVSTTGVVMSPYVPGGEFQVGCLDQARP